MQRGRWLARRGETGWSGMRATLRWVAASCVLLFVLGLAASPLLHELQQTAGWRGTLPQEAVWMQRPAVVSKGISLGQDFGVVVVFGSRSSIPYTVRASGRVLDRGVAVRFGTRSTGILVFGASATGWLSISFTGIKVPLQIWVHR